jgi:hypothetical protein
MRGGNAVLTDISKIYELSSGLSEGEVNDGPSYNW